MDLNRTLATGAGAAVAGVASAYGKKYAEEQLKTSPLVVDLILAGVGLLGASWLEGVASDVLTGVGVGAIACAGAHGIEPYIKPTTPPPTGRYLGHDYGYIPPTSWTTPVQTLEI